LLQLETIDAIETACRPVAEIMEITGLSKLEVVMIEAQRRPFTNRPAALAG
jgi:hypothetical protein